MMGVSDIDILKAVRQLGLVKSICRWMYYRLWLVGLATESSLQQLWQWNPVISISWSASVTASLLSPHFVLVFYFLSHQSYWWGRSANLFISGGVGVGGLCLCTHASADLNRLNCKLAIPCAVVLQVCTLKTLCFMQNCCMQWMCTTTVSGNDPTAVLQSVCSFFGRMATKSCPQAVCLSQIMIILKEKREM